MICSDWLWWQITGRLQGAGKSNGKDECIVGKLALRGKGLGSDSDLFTNLGFGGFLITE